MDARRGRVRAAVVTMMLAGVGVQVVTVPKALAATSVTLTASAIVTESGESIELTATSTTTRPVAYTWIYDETANVFLGDMPCGSSTCTATDSHVVTGALSESHTYYAWVDTWGCPGGSCDEYATSAKITVTWVGDDPGGVRVEPAGGYSSSCATNGGQRVLDNTVEGVHTFLYTRQPSATEVDVCFRAESGSTGVGGMFVITPATPGVRPPGLSSVTLPGVGVPSNDSDSLACATTTEPPNRVPGSHPMAFGGVGPVQYLVDSYLSDAEAWVCLQVGTEVDTRVVVPLTVSGTPGASIDPGTVSIGYLVTFYPDSGTL